MFPTDINLSDLIDEAAEDTAEKDTRIHRSFLFDFDKGQHKVIDGTPKECTELEAIKQWLQLMCLTGLDKYAVYKDEPFGTSAEFFLGYRKLPYGFIASEIQREVEEACQLNPAIEYVDNFIVSREGRKLKIEFTAHLVHDELLEVSYVV